MEVSASCSYKLVFNEVAMVASVLNATTLSAFAPVIRSSTLSAYVIMMYDQYTVETTNAVDIPLMSPRIESYMIHRLADEDSSLFQLSLFGSNFGFVDSSVVIRVKPPSSESTTVCRAQHVTNEFASCTTEWSEGSVILTRNSARSNTLSFALEDIHFDTAGFQTNVTDYLVYPTLFNTTGGDLMQITGSSLPSPVEVTLGNNTCAISHANSTCILCVIPPGQGQLLPVYVVYKQQILLRLFASYKAPEITCVSPSSLLYDTDSIVIEGYNFGLSPTVEISGILQDTIACEMRSHSHFWISCSLGEVDPVGMVLQVVTEGQSSSSVRLVVAPPLLESVTLFNEEGEELPGVPTAGNVTAHFQGENLNAANTKCLMNQQELVILEKNSTDIFCLLSESFDADAKFSITAGIQSTNTISFDFLPPQIESLSPSSGSTQGGTLVHVEGDNFGCSPDLHVSYIRLLFGEELIPPSQIVSCSHQFIDFLTPQGQGAEIPVTIGRYNQSSLPPHFFHYFLPSIEALEGKPMVVAEEPSFGGELQTEQYVFELRGQNFGVHGADVRISERECAIIQQNHTVITCIAPLFFGGVHSMYVTVAGQRSNSVNYTFPSPVITEVLPLVVESIGATLHFVGLHLPPVSGVNLTVTVGPTAISNCHLSLASTFTSHFIECHLPELRRGRWPLTLTIENLEVVLPEDSQILTVVCPSNYFAKEGDYCSVCPENTLCIPGAEVPEAPSGSWILKEDNSSYPVVEPCFNPSACAGGNKCLVGYSEFKCSQCDVGYSRYNTWTCQQCNSGLLSIIPVVRWIFVCVLLYLASLSRFVKSHIWYSLLIDTFQLIGLLATFRNQFSPILRPFLDFCSMFILDVDPFHLDCVFTSLSDSMVWILTLLILLVCFVIDGVIRIVFLCTHSKGELYKHFGQVITQLTCLLYVLFIPLLYHSLQSLSCNNRSYIAQYAIQFTSHSVCWTQQNYLWILILSGVLLLLAIAIPAYSFAVMRREKIFTDAMPQKEEEISQDTMKLVLTEYPQHYRILSSLFNDYASLFLYASFVLKFVVAILLTLFREEKHLVIFLLLLLIILLILYLTTYPPFDVKRYYTEALFSRDTLQPIEETDSPLSSEERKETFKKIRTTEKRFVWNPNTLLVLTLFLFVSLFADVAFSTVTPDTALSALSGWRIFYEILLDLLFSGLVACCIASGCAEIASLILKRPLAFFDQPSTSALQKQEKEMMAAPPQNLGTDNSPRADARRRLQLCLKEDISLPTIPVDIDYMNFDVNAATILQQSIAALMQNKQLQEKIQERNRAIHPQDQEQRKISLRELFGEMHEGEEGGELNLQTELEKVMVLFEKRLQEQFTTPSDE